jgi:hypothetical protein
MFTLPSIWNILISTAVFVVAFWTIKKWLASHELKQGATRSLLAFVLAYAVSYAAGALVDWGHDKLYGPTPPSPEEQAVKQLLKDNGIDL